MKTVTVSIVALAGALFAGASSAPATAPNAGDKAPTVEPSEWINAPASFSWASLRGRLVLVEKWATWCPPCRESIPHLGELHKEFASKGLTIIGSSDEAVGTIRPFVGNQKMEYVVAVGGTADYETSGIPHAWLVSPKGKVLWEGHPTSLQKSLIEENLKEVRLPPEIKLPKELASAQKSFDAGKLGAAIQDLERQGKSAKVEAVATAAKGAAERIRKYGEEQIAFAVDLGKEKDFASGMWILSNLEKAYSGVDVSQKAKTQRTAWTKDKEIQAELAAEGELDKARSLIHQKKFKEAAAVLDSISGSKKLSGTVAAEVAKKQRARLIGKI